MNRADQHHGGGQHGHSAVAALRQMPFQWVNRKELPVTFSSLVIHATALSEHYPGGLLRFLYDVPGAITNGMLVVYHEMMSIPATLHELITTRLIPHGLHEEDHWVIGQEESLWGVDGYHYEPRALQWCLGLPWLESLVDTQGSKVWHGQFNVLKGRHSSLLTRPETQHWTFWYDQHPLLRHIRLKKLNVGYPPFDMEVDRMDVVDLGEYLQHDAFRLPLVVGTPFGIYPTPARVFPDHWSGLVAVLGKSLLSGNVAGLMVYELEGGQLKQMVVKVKNGDK